MLLPKQGKYGQPWSSYHPSSKIPQFPLNLTTGTRMHAGSAQGRGQPRSQSRPRGLSQPTRHHVQLGGTPLPSPKLMCPMCLLHHTALPSPAVCTGRVLARRPGSSRSLQFASSSLLRALLQALLRALLRLVCSKAFLRGLAAPWTVLKHFAKPAGFSFRTLLQEKENCLSRLKPRDLGA